MENEFNESKPKGRKIAVIIIIVCVLGVAAAAVYVFGFKKNGSGGGFPGGWGGAGGPGASVVSVKTITAAKGELHDYVKCNGEIQPQTSIDVFPDIGGKVSRVNVALGTKVYRGQVLAMIDPSSPGEYYANSPVTAPISGTITAAPLRVGTKVTSGTSITTVGDVENLQVSVSIPERYVAALSVGLKADIVLEAYPDEVFVASVTRVSPLVDSVSRTKKVILNFDESNERIQAGMFAKVKLWTNVYSDAVTVPVASVTEVNDEKYVFIVKSDNTVEKRYVKTGNSVDNDIQIVEGISVGETVVVEGMRVLSEGAAIKDITNGIQTDYSVNAEENPPAKGKKAGGKR